MTTIDAIKASALSETDKQKALLDILPPEFRAWASWSSYDRGHSAGDAEITAVLTGIVYDLQKPIDALIQRVRKESTVK